MSLLCMIYSLGIISLSIACAYLCKSIHDLNKRIDDLWDFILNV